MTKVLLVNPAPDVAANPPLGLLYVAATLEKAGTEVKVHDLGFDRHRDKLERLLRNWEPQLVGITCTTPLYPHAKSVAEFVKKILPESWIIFGGIHPSVAPQNSLADSVADIVAIGEGEELMPAVAKAYPSREEAARVPGVVIKQNDRIIIGPAPARIADLDALPLPARHLVDVRSYLNASGHDRIKWSLPQPALPLIASRGCPYRCAFCASELVHGKKIRLRSIENIQQELESLISTYGIRGVYFYDDTISFNPEWFERLCLMLKGLGLKWICGTRLDRVSRPMLEMMRDCGCVLISYGIESGDQEILTNVLKKGLTLDTIRQNMKLTRQVGIATVANYMLGFPGETEESMRKTIALSRELDSDIAEFSIYMALPGTELAATAMQTGAAVENDLSKFDYMRPTYTDTSLPAELVKRYHRKAVLGFYLRPRYILRRVAGIRGWDEIKANLSGLRSFASVWERSNRH
jgi:anaerobic magnesium-protoporphyrin IX monomethyl ester cyclase